MPSYNIFHEERSVWLGAEPPKAAGLVHIKTSHTPLSWPLPECRFRFDSEPCKVPGAVEIDPHQARLRRLKKNVITSARLMAEQTKGERVRAAMVTLTYRPEDDWNPRQIAAYVTRVREWMRRRGIPARYVWVLELTKAGRPHYHVLWWLPKGVTMPKADKRGWWPHGMTRSEWARNAVGYLAKYASKGTGDASFPKGARIYGVGGLGVPARLERAWWNLPVSVREWGGPLSLWRRSPGGGWVSRATGEWRDALWSVQIIGGRVFAFPRQKRWVLHTEAWSVSAPLLPGHALGVWCPLVDRSSWGIL